MLVKSVLFWDIMGRRKVIIYRRFGTTYPFNLHETDTLSINVGKQLPYDAA
jgi:hypothetical protein